MTTAQQLVIAIFRDHAQAEQAINELHQAGFNDDHIRFAGQGGSPGSFLEKIKSLFTGQDMSAGSIYDDLVRMGTPPADARYYQSEFEAGRSIVAVVGTGVPLVAINILAHNGGYGANQRFAESQGSDAQDPTNEDMNAPSTDYDQRSERQYPTSEGVNAPPNEADQRVASSADYNQSAPRREPVYAPPNNPDQGVAPSTDYGPDAGRPEPTDENTDAPLRTPNQRFAPFPDYDQSARGQEPATDEANQENRRSDL